MERPSACRAWSAGKLRRAVAGGQAGYSLLELLVTVAIAVVLLLGVGTVIGGALQSRRSSAERNELLYQGSFALQRMSEAVRRTRHLLIPLGENPATAWSESVREVLAVTLDSALDRDGDGFADGDNDRDGQVDEDWRGDITRDGVSGIVGIDDNGDGAVDNGGIEDDDEDGAINEDPLDGQDNDGDGAVDEDPAAEMNGDGKAGVAGEDDDGDGLVDETPPADDDEDGTQNEDGPEAVVYYLNGATLIERLPNPNPASGNDFTERPIAESVTRLRVERVAGARAELVDLTLELTAPGGETLTLTARARVGGAL